MLLASIVNIVSLILFRIIKISVTFDLVYKKALIFSLALALFFLNDSFRFNEMYGNVLWDQMLFHIKFPVAGANFVMVTDFVISSVIQLLWFRL
jgi:hypothetical protein